LDIGEFGMAPAPFVHCCKNWNLEWLLQNTRGSFTYIGSPNGPIQRLEPVRYVQYECYETTARSAGPKHENWPVCDPRAAPPGECGL
jgi:hypothetical protein